MLRQYRRNLITYTYVCNDISGTHCKYYEKHIGFQEFNEIFIYASQVDIRNEYDYKLELGNLVIDVVKIYIKDDNIIISSVRQTNQTKINEEICKNNYLIYKEELSKRMESFLC